MGFVFSNGEAAAIEQSACIRLGLPVFGAFKMRGVFPKNKKTCNILEGIGILCTVAFINGQSKNAVQKL